jgi:hypothetical protein
MFDVVANMKLEDLLRERAAGEPVNTHIHRAPKEPTPDFEAMRKLVHGETPPKTKQPSEAEAHK